MEQAASLFLSVNEEEMTFEKLRLVCQLALSMGRNHRPAKESLAIVSSFLVRLGTYECLCAQFGVSPDMSRFQTEFQSTSTLDIARYAAERGDVAALSIVLFRHRTELVDSMFPILSTIPISIDPGTFAHLLPVVKDDRLTDTFYAPGLGEIEPHLEPWFESSDLLMVDGTFWTEDEMSRRGVGKKPASAMGHLHLSGEDGMLAQLARYEKPRKVLIHINNTNPMLVNSSPERRFVLDAGFEVAYDGMDLEVEPSA